MADGQDIANIMIKLGLDGAGFTTQSKAIGNELKNLGAQLKEEMTRVGGFGNSLEGLKSKQSNLTQQIDLQKQKLQTLNAAYEQAVQEHGKYSTEAQRLQGQITQTRTGMNQLEGQLRTTNQEITRQSSSWNQFSTTMDGIKKNLDKVGGEFKKVGGALSVGLTAPIMAVATAAMAASGEIGKAMLVIRKSTGATGDQLKVLKQDLLEVFKTVPDDASTVAAAMAEVSKRTGETGTQLQKLTTASLGLAKVTGEDVAGQVALTTRVFGDWGISAENQVGTLDKLLRVSQNTGIGVNQLSESVVKFGGPLRQMGFDFDTSIALMGKWEKEGVNSDLVLSSLRIGLGKMAKEGVTDTNKALETMIKRIKDAGSTGQANLLAMSMFGAKAGPDMAAAIREGRFELDSLIKTLKDSPETIDSATESTLTFGEKMQVMKNQIIVAIEPLGKTLKTVFNSVKLEFDKVVKVIVMLGDKFAALTPEQQKMVLVFGAILAALGPVLMTIGQLIISVGAIAGAFAAAGTAIATAGGIMAVLTGPVGITIAIIAALITIGILLWKNWDVVKATAIKLGTAIKETWDKISSTTITTWNNVIGTITRVVNEVKTTIKTIWDSIVTTTTETWGKIQKGAEDAVNAIKKAIKLLGEKCTEIKDGAIKKFQEALDAIAKWFKNNETAIKIVAGILTTIFGPALLVVGIKAAIAGGQIAVAFIANVIKTGTEAVISAAKITGSFIVAVVKAGLEAIIFGARATPGLIANIIKTGIEAVVAAARITGSFIVAVVQAGIEGTIAGAKMLAGFVASVVRCGVEGVIAAAQITGSFILSIAKAGVQAVITAAQITGSLILSLANFALEGWKTVAVIGAQTIAWIAQKVALAAGAVATGLATAAQWALNAAMSANPIGIVIVAIAGLVAGIMYLWNTNEGFRTVVIAVWDAIKGFVLNAVNGITQTVSGLATMFLTIGGNIISGLWNGISDKVTWIKDKIWGFCSGVGQAIKDFFGVKSPSTLTRGYGQNIAEGLGLGIIDKTPQVVDATEYMSTKVLESAIDGINALTDAEDKATSAREENDKIAKAWSQYQEEKDHDKKAELLVAYHDLIQEKERKHVLEMRQIQVEAIKKEIDLEKQKEEDLAAIATKANDAAKDSESKMKTGLDNLGTAIITALKNKYEQERDINTAEMEKQQEIIKTGLDKQLKDYEKSYNDQIKYIEQESADRIRLKNLAIDAIDAQTAAEDKAAESLSYQEKLKSIMDEYNNVGKPGTSAIDAINAQTAAEEKATAQQEEADKLSKAHEDYNTGLVEAEKKTKASKLQSLIDEQDQIKAGTIDAVNANAAMVNENKIIDQEEADTKTKLLETLNTIIAESDRKKVLEQRSAGIEILQDEAKKTDLMKQYNDLIAENEKKNVLASRQTQVDNIKIEIENEQTAADKKKEIAEINYNATKADLEQKAADQIAAYDTEIANLKQHYENVTNEENLQRDARRLATAADQTATVELLKTYNASWQNAGQSFGEALLYGLNSTKTSIQTAVNNILALVGQTQNAQLAVIAKAKELWNVANMMGDEALKATAHQMAVDISAAMGYIRDSSGNIIGSIPAFASGIANFSGGLARINEQGGEIVNLPNGSTVIPHDISSKSSQTTINIINQGTIVGRGGMDEFAKVIGQKLGGSYAISIGGNY